MRALLTLAVFLLAAPVLAQEKSTISTEARAGWTAMGDERSTGGLTLGVGARYVRPVDGGPWGWHAGVTADAVGVGDPWRWLGIVVGPGLGGWRDVSDTWRVSAGLSLPLGQLPTCTDWGLCMRHWGIYPASAARIEYRADSFRVGGEAGAMWVDTLSWSGAAVQLRIVGAYR